MRLFSSFCCLALLSQTALAQFGAPLTPVQEQVQTAMQSEIRSDAEKARDQNRQPVQILDFFRLQDDMRVIEILPFSGWYTKLLAPVLYDNGHLYVTHPEGFYADVFAPVPALEGMDRVSLVDWNGPEDSSGFFGASGEWNVEPVDLVLTFRNYHNFSVEDRAAVDKSVFDALKPGGLYGVIDHVRRHMEPENSENGRRVDPVTAIIEIQQAGFILVDSSAVLHRPDDELRFEVGRRSVTGNTDRFSLLFMKPQE